MWVELRHNIYLHKRFDSLLRFEGPTLTHAEIDYFRYPSQMNVIAVCAEYPDHIKVLTVSMRR